MTEDSDNANDGGAGEGRAEVAGMDPAKPPKAAGLSQTREQRLADAMRANLRRRKKRQRGQREGESS